MSPYGKTEEGFETQFGTNHMGHSLLTQLLLPVLKKSAPARIVNLSSGGHRFGDVNWEDPVRSASHAPIAITAD